MLNLAIHLLRRYPYYLLDSVLALHLLLCLPSWEAASIPRQQTLAQI